MKRHALLLVVLLGCGEPQPPKIVIEVNGKPLETKTETPQEKQKRIAALDDMIVVLDEQNRIATELRALSRSDAAAGDIATARYNAITTEFGRRGKTNAIAARRWFLEQVEGKPVSQLPEVH